MRVKTIMIEKMTIPIEYAFQLEFIEIPLLNLKMVIRRAQSISAKYEFNFPI